MAGCCGVVAMVVLVALAAMAAGGAGAGGEKGSTARPNSADFYARLGIDKTASHREVKRAFRKQALFYHPDKNNAKTAESDFRKIVQAYETLADEKLRKQYDAGGAHTFQGGQGAPKRDFDYRAFFREFDASMRRHEEEMLRAAEGNAAHTAHLKAHWESVRRAQRLAHGFDIDDLFDDTDDSTGGAGGGAGGGADGEEGDETEGKRRWHAPNAYHESTAGNCVTTESNVDGVKTTKTVCNS